MRIVVRAWTSLAQPPLAWPEDEVHLWAGRLEPPGSDLADHRSALLPDEQQRADRYQLTQRREQFIQGRAWLRRLLAAYLQRPPTQVPLMYAAGGKPVLASPWEQLQFNLSHSGDWLVAAVTVAGRVGVDIERPRPIKRLQEFVERFFSPAESAAFATLPQSVQRQVFFHTWTRKEALLKARAASVQSMDRFTVTLDPDCPARLIAWDEEPGAARQWSLGSWEPWADLVLGLAVESPPGTLTQLPLEISALLDGQVPIPDS